jgi:putative PIN family toxin of toxin-antitoxin system
MRIVLDTNVLVSGLLNPDGPPGRIIDLILDRHLVLLYDDRIIGEYLDVLARPQLDISQDRTTAILNFFRLAGEQIIAYPLKADLLPDKDDLPFAEVGISGKADTLVTGNTKHFKTLMKDMTVLSPAELISRLT